MRLDTNCVMADHVGPCSYTPPRLSEKVLKSRSALEGERKPVTAA
jgi:hypothetical protein